MADMEAKQLINIGVREWTQLELAEGDSVEYVITKGGVKESHLHSVPKGMSFYGTCAIRGELK